MTNLLNGLISREDIAQLAQNEGLNFDDEERISILESMRSIDVQACPGSGKTTLIAAKLMLLAKNWPFSHQGVCVLSHTNVAKNEIIARLRKAKTPEAQKLLSYPHFIGTIQEFVNRFLAMPIIRPSGGNFNFLDGEDNKKAVLGTGEDINSLYSSLFHKCGGVGKPWPKTQVIYDKIITQLGSLFWLNSNFDLAFYGDYGRVISYKNDPKMKVYPKLKSLKEALQEKGNYQYRDMFVFADQLLSQNDSIRRTISYRFPYVFIDEMQDTQKYQDDLLCRIFPQDDLEAIVQRFGDPDQAIFHGNGSEEPNESFNGKSATNMDFVIHKSHRFNAQLANKIKRLSYNEINLESELSVEAINDRLAAHSMRKDFSHSLIVFNDSSIKFVIHKFATIVSEQFDNDYKTSNNFLVKVVGAVGNEIEPNKDQLKIGHYWQHYDKSKSKSNFKEKSLLDAVRYCRQNSPSDWSENYSLLLKCILKLTKFAEIKDEEGRYYSATSMKSSLREIKQWKNLRESIYLMLNDDFALDQIFWCDICRLLNVIFKAQLISTEAIQYMLYCENEITVDEVNQNENVLIALVENKIKYHEGFNIELSTIHGVKGETHDATLILETKNYNFDLFAMLPHICGNRPSISEPNQALKDNPTNVKELSKMANKQFLRQLYVAASRPRHLLCIAIHKDRIDDKQEKALKDLGWKIVRDA